MGKMGKRGSFEEERIEVAIVPVVGSVFNK